MLRAVLLLMAVALASTVACGKGSTKRASDDEETTSSIHRMPKVEVPAKPPRKAVDGWQDAWSRHLDRGATLVGSKECARCHEEAKARHTQHMAQTSRRVTTENHAHWFGPKQLRAPRKPKTLHHYEVGDAVRAVAPAAARGPKQMEVAVLFGSRAHLTAIALWRGRRIVELSSSYYSVAGHWGLTPGHDGKRIGVLQTVNATEHCLYCHTTDVVWKNGMLDINASRFGIQCERCHGPGSLHEKTAMNDDGNKDIFNPASLSPDEQIRFCAQCHTRPVTVYPPFVHQRHDRLARFSGASMMLSRCHREEQPAKRMTCTDCHDPHVNVDAKRVQTKTQKVCLRCHDKPSQDHQSVKVSAKTLCVTCHMPTRKGFDRPGVTYTDHWIAVQNKPRESRETLDAYLRSELERYRVPWGLRGPLRPGVEEWPARWTRTLQQRR